MAIQRLVLCILLLVYGVVAYRIVQPPEYYRNLPPVDYSIANATKEDVVLTLFNSTNEEGLVLTDENISAFNLTVPTILIIHGWTTDDNSPWFAPLKEEFFKKGPYNIIYVNWSKASNGSYDLSCANVKPISTAIADFLLKSKVQVENVQIVGHSLGSQLAGFIGKAIQQSSGRKLGRITALDPAGPKFSNTDAALRLNITDAAFVDVIHSDIQHYGFTDPIGHVDFYPNSGKHQPGCPVREIYQNCSHARSTLYFIASINNKNSKAKKAEFIETNYVVEIKVNETDVEEVVFGQNVDVSAKGVYFLKTNSQKPFLL